MGTNVPPFTFGATGFVSPSGPAVLAGVQADINAAFGSILSFNLNTPQGQVASSEAAIISNTYATFQYYTQQVDPAYASGRMQDAIARIYFLERDGAEPTTLQIACSGLNGVVIPVGATISDSSGNLYQCTGAGEIVSGTVTLSFACTVPGPVAVPSVNAVEIYQNLTGWDGVTVVSGVIGTDTETRADFEARRAASVAGNSFGAAGSIAGAVAKVAGVTDFFVYDNSQNTPATVSNVTIAANSIFVCVAGGASADVAKAIWSKKSPGCSYTGTTTVVVQDTNPLFSPPFPQYNVKYTIASPLQLLFGVQIVNSPQVPSNGAVLIQNALIDAVANGIVNSLGVTVTPRARIAGILYATSYIVAIQALGAWAQVASILIGSANTPGATFVATINGTTLTIVSLTSGVIAIGQVLADTTGVIQNGTMITAGSGTSWTVNQSQTVGGATFTGNGSGTNLTATSVTGTIVVGDVIAGSGVPSGTTILSQTSGTAGGAGVYVTSMVTTSSSAALTTAETMTGSTANQTLVNVNANQEPQLLASNIAVTTI